MPFKQGGPHTFKGWGWGDYFDPLIDRLLVTTSLHDVFVVRSGPEEDEGTTHVIDEQFMPANLKTIPSDLMRTAIPPPDWNLMAYPWRIFIGDGEQGQYGSSVNMLAAGLGWEQELTLGFTIERIEQVLLDDIKPKHTSHGIFGVHPSRYTIDNNAVAEDLLRHLERASGPN